MQNVGEGFMSELEDVKWRANATAATADTVTLSGITGQEGNNLSIMAGRGFGQSREVVANNNGTLTVDEPWNVIPDTSSVVSVGTWTRRMVVYNNSFDGRQRGVDSVSHIASAAVQPYGGASDWIVVGNTIHQLREGIHPFAMVKIDTENVEGHVTMPHYFNLYADNTIDGCREGIIQSVSKHVPEAEVSVISDTGYLGNVYRGNVITNTLRAIITATDTPEILFSTSVFERNSIIDCPTTLSDGAGISNQVWVSNTTNGAAWGP
jgi:hypothetical protein